VATPLPLGRMLRWRRYGLSPTRENLGAAPQPRGLRPGVMLLVVFGLAALLVGAGVPGGASQPGPLDLSGSVLDPFERADTEAFVFIFTKSDCPISNRYAPEIRKIYEEYADRKVGFWLVYPDPDETPQQIREHVQEYDYPLMALRDPTHTLVRLAGATVTPEAAVFGPDRKLAYRGRIDNQYVAFGERRPAPTVRDLRAAVSAVLEGHEVETPTTKAVGCFISPLE